MATPDASQPVVVLRCARHGGLGITRSLGRLGVPVYLVDADPAAPAFYSRYARGRFVWNTDTALPAETVAYLGEVAAQIGRRPILIPTSDETAMLIANYAQTLRKWYEFPRMEGNLVPALCSKREMFLLARKHGLPTPETVFPQTREALLSCSESLQYPVMAKGIFGVELQRRAGRRLFVVPNRQRLLELYDAHEDWFQPNFILQELIPGDVDACWIFNGYFNRNSDCLAAFTGRKVRQCPAEGGLTSLGECRRNEEIDRITRDFVKACGYRGALDIDYQFDKRDRQYKVVDINPRVGATFRLFVGANGLDVVRAMYLDLTGQPVEFSHAPEGRRWVVEDCDLISSLHSLRRRKLSPTDWLKSYRGVAEAGVFAFDDAVPMLRMGMNHIRKLWNGSSRPFVQVAFRKA